MKIKDKTIRRIVSVSEVVGLDPTTKDLLTNDVFKWDPKKDTFTYYGRSYVLEKMARRFGIEYDGADIRIRNQLESDRFLFFRKGLNVFLILYFK